MNTLMATALLACSSKGDSSGYGVVDMMPEPARCAKEGAPSISATATGVARPDGKWEVSVKFTVSDPDTKLAGLRSTYSPSHVATGEFTADATGATVKAVVDASSDSVRLVLSMSCGDAGTGALAAEVKWGAGHLKDASYPVTIEPSA
jgi:hypothetical protein